MNRTPKVYLAVIVLFLISFLHIPKETKNGLSIIVLDFFPTPTATQSVLSEQSQSATVKRVVDGDTVVLTISGNDEKVRLIGVNSPETVDPRKPVECFGKEAKEYMKNLLSGKRVRLESDSTQQDRDKYGRLLRYIFLSDGRLVNQLLIQEGYAYEYTYDLPYVYQAAFKKAQKEASDSEKGLWSPSTCQGQK